MEVPVVARRVYVSACVAGFVAVLAVACSDGTVNPSAPSVAAPSGIDTGSEAMPDERVGIAGDRKPRRTPPPTPVPVGLNMTGEQIVLQICSGCHGNFDQDPPNPGPTVSRYFPNGRKNLGERTCSIKGALYGTFVFRNGVPAMDFLKPLLSDANIQSVADYLNSRPVTNRDRFITTCAGCHGEDARGGRVGENIVGESADEVRKAIGEVDHMRHLRNCLPRSDTDQIGAFLSSLDDDDDDDDSDDDD